MGAQHEVDPGRGEPVNPVRPGLEEQHEPVRDALAAGELLAEQARVIVEAVDALPADRVDPETIAEAEARLIADARNHDAKALRVLGRRILDVLAPEVGEAHEAAVLEAEEREAALAARLSMVDYGHGKTHGRFTLPTLRAHLLRKHLLALAAPRHQRSHQRARAEQGTPESQRRPLPDRLGRAFLEYVERYPADRLPHAGRDPRDHGGHHAPRDPARGAQGRPP